MRCPRCEGLLVQDDLHNFCADQPYVKAERCVNCGHVQDTRINQHTRKERHDPAI